MAGFRPGKAVALMLKGVILFVIWGVIAFGVWKYLRGEWRLVGDVTAFDGEADWYLAEFPWLDPPLEEGVHIRGRAVVADVTEGLVLPLTFELPDDITPSTPEEVGTVIQIERFLEETGTYDDRTPAYRQNALVRIVDLGFECVIGETFIQGGEPPGEKPKKGPGLGEPPDGQIPALVAEVPRIALDGNRVSAGASETSARGGLPGGRHTSAFATTPQFPERQSRGGDAHAASGRAGAARKPRATDLTARLVEGMTPREVGAVLGEPVSHSTIGSGEREVKRYTWRLPDGSTLTCSFHADTLKKWEVE
ncbi:MAG TPA: hypothetical protein PLB67_01495 [Candidatus Hydrogenedentes bacterium]|jgi:hypothetical protein|nr:helix-turn-helix domain-containing protein [Candidatus Hydrogenedentota bacterium]NLT59044.1 hypothetical protein [Candidatus Hydrogenedentota bacterium]HNV21998.1 hypothetical protein [Candidatus Hydrogenedentota bacterium]HPA03076.1 hypothetical protein [Candidatus Hydrogenedentota bacterium]HPV37477.1 hypothetical protein [Candidatus Hydrogenedentota bacterium]